MADNDFGDKTNNGNDWDVVSLTASTYAAAPSYVVHDINSDGSVIPFFGGETPRTMFLLDHFVFPPSQHENLPLEPDVVEEVHPSEEEMDEGSVLGECDEERGELDTLDERGELDTLDERHERQLCGETLVEEDAFQSKVVEVSAQATTLSPNLLNAKMVKDKKLQPKIPSGAWWKRHAASLYSNAKESNSFWSIFVAAAVTGLVIIGQKWQQERWQILQLKLHLHLNDEKMARLLGPLNRLKDAVIGNHHPVSLPRSSASIDH
ncbi:hypothetical protein QQ045_006658 [Rhodiola kirilowii]